MGKKSVKENKNMYYVYREKKGYTREQASEKMGFISASRIEKIDNEKSIAHPEEVLEMSKCYEAPEMCNLYCSHECPIGQEYVPEIKAKDLSQITLEMLASLNSLEKFANHNKFEFAIKVSKNNYGFNSEQKLLTIPFYFISFVSKDLADGTMRVS